jgi:hypothetical protein
MDIVDMTVHVDETLSPEKMHELEDAVRAEACVVTACCSKNNPHLLSVTFDPDCTSSASVLHRVQSHGVHAELVCL